MTLALILVGLADGKGSGAFTPQVGASSDLALYARAVDAAHTPASFYAVTIAEQRRRGYPLRPFVTVRPPVLAFALAPLPGEGARRLAIGALAAAVFIAWAVRLDALAARRALVLLPWLLILITGLVPAVMAQAYLLHETWAGLLIALSLAINGPKAWRLSVVLGFAAALVRELAAPYLAVMAFMALMEGRRREAAAWLGVIALWAVVLSAHALAISSFVTPADPASPGWMRLGGWAFVLQCVQWNAGLVAAPAWAAETLLPLALLGAVCWPGPVGARLALTVSGFVAGFLFIGRPANFYWGLMITPLLPLGLIMAPTALFTLMRRLIRA